MTRYKKKAAVHRNKADREPDNYWNGYYAGRHDAYEECGSDMLALADIIRLL